MNFRQYSLIVGEQYPELSLLEQIADKKNIRLENHLYRVRLEEQRFLLIAVNYDDGKYSETVFDTETEIEKANPRRPYELEYADQFFACYDALSKELYLSNTSKRAAVKKLFANFVDSNTAIRIREHISSAEEFASVVKAIRRVRYTQTRNLVNTNPNSLFAQCYNPLGLDLPDKLISTLEYEHWLRADKAIAKLRDLFNKGRTQEIASLEILGIDDEGFERIFSLDSVIKSVSIDIKPDENKHYDSDTVFLHLLAKLRG